MKPLTLAEVNATIRETNKRIAKANGLPDDAMGTWAEYQSADEPYTGMLRSTLIARYRTPPPEPVSREINRLAENLGAMPIGFAIARVNRILETIPEPEGVEHV